MNLRRLVMATLVAGMAVVTAAQQQPAPVFRSSTQFVTVDVVVTGKDDAPVTDLTKDDFEISENGKAQKISEFAFISIPLANRAIDVDAPPRPPSDVASNATSAQASRAIVVLVDDASLTKELLDPTHSAAGILVDLKTVLTTFLKSLTSDDQVAIIWQSRSDVSQDFTNDIPRLIAGVNSRRAAMGLTAIGPAWRAPTFSLKFAVAALSASHYARRAIVYMGTAICNPISMSVDMEGPECRDLYKKAKEANVPIYALDPRTNPETPATNLEELAINTGGRAFLRQSRPTWAMEQILIENGSFYTLGFYPEPVVNDGKYHDIKVTVKRPGIIVRSRDRYLADTATKPASTPHRDMTSALGAGLDDPSLPVRASVVPMMPLPRGGTRSLVTIEVTYPVPDGGISALNDELRVGILALTPDAKIKASFQRPIQFIGKWKPTARGSFVINETVDLPTDQLTVRVGITSKALGKTGTAHITVDVPNYLDSALQISPIVLGSTSATMDAATSLDTVRALVPFQPTTARAFSRAETLRVFARAYWRSNEPAVEATLTMTGSGMMAPRKVVLKGDVPSPGRRQSAFDVTLPLADLAPGSYVLRVEARLPKGKPAWREIPITVK